METQFPRLRSPSDFKPLIGKEIVGVSSCKAVYTPVAIYRVVAVARKYVRLEKLKVLSKNHKDWLDCLATGIEIEVCPMRQATRETLRSRTGLVNGSFVCYSSVEHWEYVNKNTKKRTLARRYMTHNSQAWEQLDVSVIDAILTQFNLTEEQNQ